MTPRARLEARIPVALKRELTALAQRQQVALTDLVEAALRQLLRTAPPPEPSVTQRLTRVLRDLRDLQQAVEVLEETLGLFINVYFSTTPEVPSEQEEAARRRGGRRYARFLQVLEGKLARAGRGNTTAEGAEHDPAGTSASARPRA
jgi:hypothetical protein